MNPLIPPIFPSLPLAPMITVWMRGSTLWTSGRNSSMQRLWTMNWCIITMVS